MPIGVICNVLSVIIGGVLGGLIGHKLPKRLTEGLTLIFSICAMGMGVSSLQLMENMPPVILAVVLGTGIGLLIHLGDAITKGGRLMQRTIAKIIPARSTGLSEEEFLSMLLTIIVLFCASGTGIYGSLDSGMSGDHTILISKSILDLFTAMIFAINLGYVVSVIAIPQTVIFLALFYAARLILPLTTPTMINDFKACGGFLLLATSFRMMKVKVFPLADMIPAMILVMPFSWMWTNWIMPLL